MSQITRKALRFSDLSGHRQQLVRLCQATNYGQIQGLELRDGEPVVDPEPIVWIDVKLGVDEGARPEPHSADFTLQNEICGLMAGLDQIHNGVIDKIEIRAGIPRRLFFRRRSAAAPR